MTGEWVRGLKERWKQVAVEPGRVRNFGLMLAGLLILIGTVAWIRDHGHYGVLWLFGLLVLFVTFRAPRACSDWYRAWMVAAGAISWVLLRVILGAFFYLVLSPMACVMRLFGKDFLEESLNRQAISYWQKRERKPTRRQYERLF